MTFRDKIIIKFNNFLYTKNESLDEEVSAMKSRRFLMWLFAVMVCMGLTIIPVSAQENGKCGENVYWVYDDNGTLTISGTGEMYNLDKSGNISSDDLFW